MKRSHIFALSGIALFLLSTASPHAQGARADQQCQPDVADASIYGNCRLRIVRGQEVCRCAILPQAQPRHFDAQPGVTGSVARITPAPRSQLGLGAPYEIGLSEGHCSSRRQYMYNDSWIDPATGLPACTTDGRQGGSSGDAVASNPGTSPGGNSGGGAPSTGNTGGGSPGHSGGGGNPGGGANPGTPGSNPGNGGGTSNPTPGGGNGGTPGGGDIGGGSPGGGNHGGGKGNQNGGRGNNGHGNDDDRNDASNPGRSNNGDNTDQDGRPGNSGGRGNQGGGSNAGSGGKTDRGGK